MVLAQSEVNDHGEGYFLDATTKASAPSDRQARFAPASCRCAQQMVMLGTTGYFCLQKNVLEKRVISVFKSSSAFYEIEMFALTLEQPFLQGKQEECNYFFWESKKIVSSDRGGLEVKIVFLNAEVAKTAVPLPPAHCFSLCTVLFCWADWWMCCTVLSNLVVFFPLASGVLFSAYICTLHNLRHLIISHHWHFNKQDLLS